MEKGNKNADNKGLTSFFDNSQENVDSGFTPVIPDSGQFYCDAMNDDNINMVLNNVKPELIVLIGFSGYGKSTLVGSLYYYLLCKGEVEGYEMYDSDTFSGFERRLYLRNIKNDETAKSKTLRTEEEDEFLLTLSFYNQSQKEKKQIIISDRAGETYRKYVDVKEHIKKDASLPRAQRVIILVDTPQLGEAWDVEEGRFRQLFSGLRECNKMPREATYSLLFNKIDLVENNLDLKRVYDDSKQMIIDFFTSELGLDSGALDCWELDSKHIHDNSNFEAFVKNLVKKNDTSKNEEQRLKKVLDWVGEKLR